MFSSLVAIHSHVASHIINHTNSVSGHSHAGSGFLNSIIHGIGWGIGNAFARHLPFTIIVIILLAVLGYWAYTKLRK